MQRFKRVIIQRLKDFLSHAAVGKSVYRHVNAIDRICSFCGGIFENCQFSQPVTNTFSCHNQSQPALCQSNALNVKQQQET